MRLTEKETERKSVIKTEIHSEKQARRLTNREAEKQRSTDKQTEAIGSMPSIPSKEKLEDHKL